MNKEIKLPPLPDLGPNLAPYWSEQVREKIIAWGHVAVELDRQQREEAIAEIDGFGNLRVLPAMPADAKNMKLFAAPQPAEPTKPFQGKIERHSDNSVLVSFPSCRLASEFERNISAYAELVVKQPLTSEREAFEAYASQSIAHPISGHIKAIDWNALQARAALAEPVAEVTHCKPDNYSANLRIKWLTQQEFPVGTKLCVAPVAAQPSVPPLNVPAVEAFVDEYLGEYELRSDEGSYKPSETEIFLIMDAINGLLADDEFMALLRSAPPACSQEGQS